MRLLDKWLLEDMERALGEEDRDFDYDVFDRDFDYDVLDRALRRMTELFDEYKSHDQRSQA